MRKLLLMPGLALLFGVLLILPTVFWSDPARSQDGRHRVDMSVTSLDAREADIYTLLPAYNYTLNAQFRVGLTGQYNYASIDDRAVANALDANGFGDTDLLLQYAPSAKLTSSPWIPETLGLSFGLTLPTGEKGYGGDYWAYRLGLGWAFPIKGSLYLLPAIEFEDTFSEDSGVSGVTTYGAGLGVQWVADNGFWVGYTPFLEKDSEFKEWADDHSLIIGKMWSGGLGVSLQYGQRKRLDKSAVRDDYTGLINFYYQFGSPP